MKEFVLTQPYASISEMVNSGEMAVYKEELMQGNIEEYAIISRIGNRYDINGNKIDGFAKNPYRKEKEEEITVNEEKTQEMKYIDIETLIDKEVEKAVALAKETATKEIETLKSAHQEELTSLMAKHLQETTELKNAYILELAKAKEEARKELIAKLTV